MTTDYPKAIKRQLRHLMERAYEQELTLALRKLAADVDAWRAGTLRAGELSERIHHFDTGIARELFKRYQAVTPEILVAYAVVGGILQEADIPDEVWPYLQNALAFYRRIDPPDVSSEGDEPEAGWGASQP